MGLFRTATRIYPDAQRFGDPSFVIHLRNSRRRYGVVCPLPGRDPGFWIDSEGLLSSDGFEFAYEGEVRSLFDLFAIPVTGWNPSQPVVAGCGYLARFRYWQGGTGPHYYYLAIYVAEYTCDARSPARRRAVLHCRPL